MAGAASGLFVAALVGTSHAALTNQAFLLLMMIGGAVGFYLGIDTPPQDWVTFCESRLDQAPAPKSAVTGMSPSPPPAGMPVQSAAWSTPT